MTRDVEVSLIMCVWRARPEWLEAAVISALDDDSELELVIVDDGNEIPVADTLAVHDPRIRHVRIPHGGQLSARDAGTAAARGRYLRSLDADDVVVAGSTSKLLTLAAGRSDLIAYGAVTVCDEELRPQSTIASTLTGDVVVPSLLGDFQTRHVAMLIPRPVVTRAGPWATGPTVSADWDFVLRALEHAEVIGTVEPVVLYRRHGASASRRADVEIGERARDQIIARYLDRNLHMRGTTVERAARVALLTDRALAYAAAGDRRRALDRLWHAARLAPLSTVGASITAARLFASRGRGSRSARSVA